MTVDSRKKGGQRIGAWVLLTLAWACSPDSGPAPGPNGTPDAGSPTPRPDGSFATPETTSRFLTQATFGPRPRDVETLTGGSASNWVRAQLAIEPTLLTPAVLRERNKLNTSEEDGEAFGESVTLAFWQNTISAPDQLRQRMAWALSQIFVVSNAAGELLADMPEGLSYFQDQLILGAFGNLRDLLTEVTYAPAMAYYLTYLGSRKANPVTGQMPDENYARELMQLFTIGVVEMGPDGQPRPRNGRSETYDNGDVTGLAKVFTGMRLANPVPDEPWGALPPSFRTRLVFDESQHSTASKTFLGTTIPENTPGPESVRLALDALFAHPNVAPFIGRQLIQRFVTSAPQPAYVGRVSRAFETGSYTLPDGGSVGTGRRGDLEATLMAVLFDEEARDLSSRPDIGKVREPLLRMTAWVRSFDVGEISPLYLLPAYDTASPLALKQHPYRSPSVFNFFRPGYVAPGTRSGQAGMTAPELQIVSASTVPGYANFLYRFVTRSPDAFSEGELEDFEARGLSLDAARRSFMPDYTAELARASDPVRLVDHLSAKLTYGTMSSSTKARIVAALEALPGGDPERRVQLAVWMAMISPDFLVQR